MNLKDFFAQLDQPLPEVPEERKLVHREPPVTRNQYELQEERAAGRGKIRVVLESELGDDRPFEDCVSFAPRKAS